MIPEGLIRRACSEALGLEQLPQDLNQELSPRQRRELQSYLASATGYRLPVLQFSPGVKARLAMALWGVLAVLIACSILTVSKGMPIWIFLAAPLWLILVLVTARILAPLRSTFIHGDPEKLEQAILRMNRA